MSERAAWLYLAKAWDGAKPGLCHGGKNWGVEIDAEDGPSPGLCCCILDLERMEDITEVTAKSMLATIKLNDHAIFSWTLDANGAKSRAAFCRKQAAKLTKKKVKK
jgi:hypothetical protein